MFVSLALLALLIEATVGYPPWLFAAIGHPVSWIGALIARLEQSLNRAADPFAARRLRGLAAVLIVLGATLAVAMAAVAAAGLLPGPLDVLMPAILASTLLAQRSLAAHVEAVAVALDHGGLDAGRVAVAQIVGRDPASLDTAGVSRAAIESLAENFSDGVVAPLFWMVVAGLPGAALYKAINTADSMIGHKSERYLAFGWAAARLDDLVNLPASRLAAFWLVVAAALLPGASAANALVAMRRDARHHSSPNAGWPEAAIAGALGLKLAGPRSYGGEVVAASFMGDGRASATADDIRRALTLYRAACCVQIACLIGVAVLMHAVA